MIPTMIGITLVSFIIINLAPGGPIEQKLQQMRFGSQASGGSSGGGGAMNSFGQRTNQGMSEQVLEALKKQYGFDKPMHERYIIWLGNLSRLDFGQSFTFEEPVIDVIKRKLPVSMQFGLISFLLSYLICVPLGIAKAIRQGQKFDTITSIFLFVTYSTPSFMLAIVLIVLFGGGSFYNWFPIQGIMSDNYDELSGLGKLWDRIHHFILPLLCYMIGSFASLTLLMKNSLLEEIKKDYVRTARAKGLSDRIVIYRHTLRNALIPIATGFGTVLSVFFAGSLLLETIFGLDGIGLLGYQSILSRDYNVLMGLLAIQSLLFLAGNILSDFLYVVIDPRIDFSHGSEP